jgi:lysine 2,3-aminomutase
MTRAQPNPKYVTSIDRIDQLDDAQRQQLRPVVEKFVFRSNDYYQSLINWQDPNDPIRRIVMPDIQELQEFGNMDASDEWSYTVVKGLEHKYADTALVLINDVCGAYCRFCFRKRLFTDGNDEVTNDISEALLYIRLHTEIDNVLLSGGDPLIMSSARLESILQPLRLIDHVRIIRIGTKMPAFNPYRIINDTSLIDVLSRHTRPARRIFVMTHFNHPRELTGAAVECLTLLQKAGVITVNQSPIIRGVNDNADVIADLFNQLSYNGVLSYYFFICRPTAGNKAFVVPIEEASTLFERAKMKISGLAKHARLCMSHKTGKIEALGRTGGQVLFRYHRAVNEKDCGRLLVFKSNPEACWLDDYITPAGSEREMMTATALTTALRD